MAQGKGGGPHTPEGRERSSRNSLKHGMRAKKLHIMADESEADFEHIERSWKAEWGPEGYKEERLVEILVHNDWLLKRGFTRAYEAVNSAAGDENLPPEGWSQEGHDNVRRMLHYKAQAEASFYRSLRALEQLKKEIIRMEDKYIKVKRENEDLRRLVPPQKLPQASDDKPAADAQELTPAQKLFQGQFNEKKRPKRKIKVLEQWVYITVEDGKTVTKLYPSNDDLIKRGQGFWPPPELVYRHMDIRGPVPPEYRWAATNNPDAMKYGGIGLQRMTTDQWLICIEREKAKGDGHIGPTGVGNLPRPHERGGCNCPTCTHPANVKLLEEWEKSRAA